MSKEVYSVEMTPDSSLVRRLKSKKNNPNDNEEIKTALVIDAGVMLGAFGGGVVTGLEELGFSNTFDTVIGASTGSAIGAYFLSGQSRIGTSIYYEELVRYPFINWRKFPQLAHAGIEYLEDIFRGNVGTKRLDVNAIRLSSSELLIGVTNAQTGTGELLSSRDPDIDLVTAIKGSIAMPIAYNEHVHINGQSYCDGVIGAPLPIQYAIEDLGVTDIMVILHKNLGFRSNLTSQIVERVMAALYMKQQSPEMKSKFIDRHKSYGKIMDWLWTYDVAAKGANVGVVALENTRISPFSMNPQEVKSLAEMGERQVREIFD